MPRMATFGATGFLTAGWKAPLEDRFAAATVFGAAGAFGPWAEGKSLKRVRTDLELRYKQLAGELPARKALVEKADNFHLEIQEAKSLLTSHGKVSTRLEEIKKAQAKGNRYKPLTETEKGDLIKDPNKVYELQNKIDLGLPIDISFLNEFQKKTKHYNLIYANGMNFIQDFFKLNNKFQNDYSDKIISLLGKNKLINNFFVKVADKGFAIH